MNNHVKAIALMGIWTIATLTALYFGGAFEHYRSVVWILPISMALLGIHMVNMVIYFKLAGDTPYQWRKVSGSQ